MGSYLRKTQKVVIKRTKPLFLSSGHPRSIEHAQSFIKEVQVLSHTSLSTHPNVISLLGISWHCEQSFPNPAIQPHLVLEAADGTLEDFLSHTDNLPFRTQKLFAKHISDGLEAVHCCGLIHGDIKLANILIIGTDSAKIADFSHSWTDTGKPLRIRSGTRGFMAPEIRRGNVIYNAKATDIYSLGVVLWRIFAGNNDLPVPSPDRTGIPGADHRDYQDDPSLAAALETFTKKAEATANEPRHISIERMFLVTLSRNPEKRCLSTVRRTLSLLSDDGQITHNPGEHAVEIPNTSSPSSTLLKNTGEAFDESFQCEIDAKAFYELGICSLSKFGTPNGAVPNQAFDYFLAAAKHGDLMTKGYMSRLFDALSDKISPRSHLEVEPYLDEWLLEAAVAGHQAAFEDYTQAGTNHERKKRIIDIQASKLFTVQPELQDLETFKRYIKLKIPAHARTKDPQPSFEHEAIHWAAYKNLDEHIRVMAIDMKLDINQQNDQLETPLMTACSMGNLQAALALIECGCDVHALNIHGESCLHYLWRFCDKDAKCLLKTLTASGIDFDTISHFQIASGDGKTVNRPIVGTDPLPVLHGKAIERLAARGRTALLDELLSLAPPINPSNGNMVRRMVLWATLLNHPDTRKLLIDYGEGPYGNQKWKRGTKDLDLPLIETSIWEDGDCNKDYMGAVAKRWLSVKGKGWSTTEIFWRTCCHGRRWESILQNTIRAIQKGSHKRLCGFESALQHALQDRRPEFCRLYLTMYIDDHEANPFADGFTLHVPHPCAMYMNPQVWRGGFEIAPLDQPAALVDRILFKGKNTLLQSSIIHGDRNMFQILLDLQANLMRPWTDPQNTRRPKNGKSGWDGSSTVYLNCYSLLALHSRDIWFA
ncbi:hypothetical protein N7540_011443 [Penicillium herquei]|nr:hypothetical protein N7540_011443 [Penicillium herquei]